MSEIRVLPEALINQIAAGEVVERPASVVKELVENALDAGATRVDVAIAEGGIRWISVQDDGSGLARSDAELAFTRHATSKIAAIGDLERVTTLGFRGEALPSIAAVARVRMRTRRSQDPIGTELVGEGDGIREVHAAEGPAGTRVEVAELFGRIPARRKFLKSPQTEATHCVRWLERVALARPDLHLTLERNGRKALHFPPTQDVRERLVAVLPPSLGERLVPIAGDIGFARLHGFASPTDVGRGTTNDIHLFVNRRPVRDRLLLFGLREAYRDALPPGRQPAAVVYLEVDPDQLDVNVHPAKWEVRFRKPEAIRALLRDALVQALGLGRRAPPPARAFTLETRAEFAADRPHDLAPPPDLALNAPARTALGSGAAPRDNRQAFSFRSLRYLGQGLGTYLLFDAGDRLVLLDQHAAHERVLFERLRRLLVEDKVERQILLLPAWLELPRSTADALSARQAALERAGFELEIAEGGVRGGVRVGVRSVPAVLAERRDVHWPRLLEETATLLVDPSGSETRDGLDAALHSVLATTACHAATRKGDRLQVREVETLLEALDATVWFPNCPHGRPILAVFDEAELERRFLRR